MKKQIDTKMAIIVIVIVVILALALFLVLLKGKAPRGGGESMPQQISPFGKMDPSGQPPEGASKGALPPGAAQEGTF